MAVLRVEFKQRRLLPNKQQVRTIRNQLGLITGLDSNQQIDYVFDGINTWNNGYNIATLAIAFDPYRTEEIKGTEYPTKESIMDMKKKINFYKVSTECEKLVLYPSRGPTGKGEWRYFHMQSLDDYALIERMDDSIIKGIMRWLKTIKKLLKEDPKYRNEEHKKEVEQIRYRAMLHRRMLRQLEKSKKAVVVSGNKSEDEKGGEQDQNETDEK